MKRIECDGVGDNNAFFEMSAMDGLSGTKGANLSDLLCCEGPFRESFEALMKKHHYKAIRNNFGEYEVAAVFHMWTGYCLAKAT